MLTTKESAVVIFSFKPKFHEYHLPFAARTITKETLTCTSGARAVAPACYTVRNRIKTLRTSLSLALILPFPQFFYYLAGNVQNSSIKTMVNYFTAICPQCRKRLDKTDNEDSPGAQAAASSDKPKAAVDVCSSQLDEVRIRCDQHTHEVKA